MAPPDSYTDRFIWVWQKAVIWLPKIAAQTSLSGFGRKQEYGSTGYRHRQVYLGLTESRNMTPPDIATDNFVRV